MFTKACCQQSMQRLYRTQLWKRTGEHILIPAYDFIIRNLWKTIGFANMDPIRIYHSIRRDRGEGRRLGKDHLTSELAVHRTRKTDTGSRTRVSGRLAYRYPNRFIIFYLLI